MGCMLFECALECTHYARIIRVRTLHACARSYISDGFSPNFVEQLKGYRELHGLLDFYVHLRVRAMRIRPHTCAHTQARMCTLAHIKTYSLYELHAFYIHACIFTLYAHYARACSALHLFTCFRYILNEYIFKEGGIHSMKNLFE
jgi:hypothetical protein